MIVGEAGVGKGAVAKNIFYQSKRIRGEKPFMTINLSVLDDRELEAILFGFDRGVEGLPYTSKRGLFEQANGGTVLIEEIEEASFRNQMKILTFINERKTRRIGGDTQEPVNIRLIVTLKADPAELLEKRKLLEDLYAKLLEFEKIEIPPLRERPEDIPLLVRHFSARDLQGAGDGRSGHRYQRHRGAGAPDLAGEYPRAESGRRQVACSSRTTDGSCSRRNWSTRRPKS